MVLVPIPLGTVRVDCAPSATFRFPIGMGAGANELAKVGYCRLAAAIGLEVLTLPSAKTAFTQ